MSAKENPAGAYRSSIIVTLALGNVCEYSGAAGWLREILRNNGFRVGVVVADVNVIGRERSFPAAECSVKPDSLMCAMMSRFKLPVYDEERDRVAAPVAHTHHIEVGHISGR